MQQQRPAERLGQHAQQRIGMACTEAPWSSDSVAQASKASMRAFARQVRPRNRSGANIRRASASVSRAAEGAGGRSMSDKLMWH